MSSDKTGEGEILLKNFSRKFSSDSDSENDDILHFTKIELQERHLDSVVVDSDKMGLPSSCGSCFVVLASVMASLGGIVFGYDIGIISGAILQLKEIFCLSCLQQEMIISALLLGSLAGSLTGGFIIDGIGRRLTMIVNAVIFIVGALILSSAPNYSVLLFGRLVLGYAVSLSATAECIYISEIAPAKRRGLLVSLNELGITLGFLLAFMINFVLIDLENGWRYMFGLSAVPAFIQGVGMFFLPPSPRYLMLKNNETKAEEVLIKLRGGARFKVQKELENIRASIATEKDHKCLDLLSKTDNMRGRMFIAAGIVLFVQLTGQPTVLYYAPTIFEAVGFETNSAAVLASVGLGVIKVLMAVVALCCLDKWGRRKFLLISVALMGIAILTLGLVSHLDDHKQGANPCEEQSFCVQKSTYTFSAKDHDNASFISYTDFDNFTDSHTKSISLSDISSAEIDNVNMSISNNQSQNGTESLEHVHIHGSTFGKITAFISLMLYVAAFGVGFGPVTWVILSELFPASVKGRAIAFATALNWGTNLTVSLTFLDIIASIGVSWTFVVFSIICFMALIFIYTTVPETSGKSLEQISNDLKKRTALSGIKARCSSLCWCCNNAKANISMHPSYSQVQDTIYEETIT